MSKRIKKVTHTRIKQIANLLPDNASQDLLLYVEQQQRLSSKGIYDKVQNVLKRLKSLGVYKVRGVTYFYTIEEFNPGTYDVLKRELRGFDEVELVLTDEEVLNDFLPDVLITLNTVIL